MADGASGLAGRIRAARESDQFDLSGYSKDQCADLVRAAFSEPFPLTAMVRLSFVVGGGKLCRQKYSDDLPKDVCTALGAIGFDEDKAAACELGSAGRYKFQHDTSKNLKFVHVFPRIAPPDTGGEAEEEEEGEDAPRTPADLLAECTLDEFRRMVASHLGGYMQRLRLMDELRSRLARLEAAEQKLIARQQLEPSEQALYDKLSVDALKEKIKLLGTEMQALIEAGKLTSEERSQVLEQLDGKLSALETELQRAVAEGKAKLQQKLEEQRDKLRTTRATASAVTPVPPPDVRYGADIRKLRQRLVALQRMEKESAGHYTLDELKRLAERPELEEAIRELETRSRLWFESDEEFKVRLDRCLREGAPARKAASGSSDGFATVASKKGSGGGGRR